MYRETYYTFWYEPICHFCTPTTPHLQKDPSKDMTWCGYNHEQIVQDQREYQEPLLDCVYFAERNVYKIVNVVAAAGYHCNPHKVVWGVKRGLFTPPPFFLTFLGQCHHISTPFRFVKSFPLYATNDAIKL